MKKDLTLLLVQPDILWEDIDGNLAMYDRILDNITEPADLIILPEMFSTGFTMNSAGLAEAPGGKTMQWMSGWAGRLGCVITGSIIVTENGRFYNRLVWAKPGDSFQVYDKRHLFKMADEHLAYSPGNRRLITELQGFRIFPLICYDLRFPVWSRNRYKDQEYDYDLLVYVANWPEERDNVWTTLLQARAIENQSYVAGVNRAGRDGNNITYSGNSMAVSPAGEIIGGCGISIIGIKKITLSLDDLAAYRHIPGVSGDWDSFTINT